MALDLAKIDYDGNPIEEAWYQHTKNPSDVRFITLENTYCVSTSVEGMSIFEYSNLSKYRKVEDLNVVSEKLLNIVKFIQETKEEQKRKLARA